MDQVKRDTIIRAWRKSIEHVAKTGVVPRYMMEQIKYFVDQTADGECNCCLEPPLDGFCLLTTEQHHEGD